MSEVTAEDVVIVGRIGGAYGVRGWVHINSFTDPPENLLSYSPWLIAKDDGWQPLEPVIVKPHGQAFVAQFAHIDNRDQAQALNATDLGIHRQILPGLADEDEFYWRDLIGLEVKNTDGQTIGTVSHLFETPAHDVLVVRGTQKTDAGEDNPGIREVLIPFTAQFIMSVDIKATCLIVDW